MFKEKICAFYEIAVFMPESGKICEFFCFSLRQLATRNFEIFSIPLFHSKKALT
jgi:hypothetical protein